MAQCANKSYLLPTTGHWPCAHASTWKRSVVGLQPTKMGNSDLFWADFSHFGPVLAILEVFLTEFKKNKKMKNLHMTLEDVTKLFFWLLLLSLIFWPKTWIFNFFLHISAILKVFLTGKEKSEKIIGCIDLPGCDNF